MKKESKTADSNNGKKRTIKLDISLIMRGYRLIGKIGSRRVMVYKLAAGVFSALYPFVNIYFSAQIINELAGSLRQEVVIWLALAAITANLLFQLLCSVFRRSAEVWECRFWKNYDMMYSEKVMDMDYADVENANIQAVRYSILENDNWRGTGIIKLFEYIEEAVSAVVRVLAAVGLSLSMFMSKTTGGNCLAAFLDSPFLAAVILVILLLSVVYSTKLAEYELKSSNESSEASLLGNRIFAYHLDEIAFDIKAGKDIRMYRLIDVIDKDIHNSISGTMKSWVSYFKAVAKGAALRSLTAPVISCVSYMLVAAKALYGAFGIGSVVQYAGAIAQLSEGANSMFEIWGWLRGNNDYLQPIFDYLDRPNEKYMGTIPVEKRDDNEYEIEFRQVSFKYPGTDTYALKDLSLRLRVGERLAVVGENGSGKTTMIKLLCRLYDPTEGEILLNGIDIIKYDYKEYMSLFSVVFQDFRLFGFPLGQNVAARVEYERAAVEEALREAGFAYEKLRNGLDTCLYREYDGEGQDVSGGEAQKIAIARGVFKRAPFLVMDEPTAALDPIAEAEIYHKLNGIVKNRTAVYISHRLSSCRFCDRIIVFHQGRLVQIGNHDTLVREKQGKYAELWQAQAQYYKENAENTKEWEL